MAAMEIEVSTPIHAYLAIRRKLLTLRRKKPTVDSGQVERSLIRHRDFAPPGVIKRLNGGDVRKEGAGVMPYVHLVENGKTMAVFLMPLHGKALQCLNSVFETFHGSVAHATKKPIVDGPLISATPENAQSPESEPTSEPTVVPGPNSPVLQENEVIARSYSTESSATTVEEPEHDPDRSDVFGQIDFEQPARQKERLTSVSSEVIWVGSLTPAPGQPESSAMNSQRKRAPSEATEITVDWQDSGADDHEREEEEPAVDSLMSVSPGSPKSSMNLKTPGQSGMPSPNIEIYSTLDTPREGNVNPLQNSTPISAGSNLKETSVAMESQEKKDSVAVESQEKKDSVAVESHEKKDFVAVETQEKKDIGNVNKVEGRPVVPFYYGSKIPVMAAKPPLAVRNKSSYGNLIAHQRRLSVGEVPSKPPTPKPHSCSATPIVTPKPRAPKRKSSASSVKSLSRKDVAAGHFPAGTPPRASTPTIITTGGSPRPKSSSKIPIPSPTTPRSTEARKQVTEMFGFGENFLSDIVEADCEDGAIWDKRRNEVMGPLGVSPTIRLGGFVRPTSSLTKNSRGPTRPMASLVALGNAVVSSTSTSSSRSQTPLPPSRDGTTAAMKS